MDDLVGRPVAELDPALAFRLLDGRIPTIEGAPVYLSVRAVVIGPETEFWVELRGTPAEGSESGGCWPATRFQALGGFGRRGSEW